MWRLSFVVLLTTTLTSIAHAETEVTTAAATTPAAHESATQAEKTKPRGTMEPIDDFKPSDLKKARTKPPAAPVVSPTDAAPTATPVAPLSAPTPPLAQPAPAKPAPAKPTAAIGGPAKTPPPLSPDEPASYRCFVRDVMAFYDRTQIGCYAPVTGKIAFFAVDTNQPIAGTVMTKALSGMRTGKPVIVTFAPEADLNPPNCAAATCRRLIDIKN